MVLTRAQKASDFAEMIFKRKRSDTLDTSTGSPLKLDDSKAVAETDLAADAEMAGADITTLNDLLGRYADSESETESEVWEDDGNYDDYGQRDRLDSEDDCASEGEDGDEDHEAGESDDSSSGPDSSPLRFRRWPPDTMEVRSSARKMREQLAELALQRKLRESIASTGEESPVPAKIAASCDLDPFASVATSGFDFAKSLDATDGPGMVGVFVEADSFSKGDQTGEMWKDWQLQRQHRSSPTYDAHRETELATMGLFARLPGELRNRIYRLVLVMDQTIPYPFIMEAETCALGVCVHANLDTALPGLLSTCRQLRAEGLPIVHHLSTDAYRRYRACCQARPEYMAEGRHVPRQSASRGRARRGDVACAALRGILARHRQHEARADARVRARQADRQARLHRTARHARQCVFGSSFSSSTSHAFVI